MTIELPLSTDEIRAICERLEALEIQEAEVMPDLGGNAADDAGPTSWQKTPDDLREDELVQEIHSLDDDQKHALVALMWIGRDDYTPEDWDEAMREAAARHETPTAQYLLSHPLAGEEILVGLDAVEAFNEDDYTEGYADDDED